MCVVLPTVEMNQIISNFIYLKLFFLFHCFNIKGKKVARLGGKKYFAVFRRLPPHEVRKPLLTQLFDGTCVAKGASEDN